MSWLSIYIKRKAFKRKNLLDALSRNKLKIKQQNELREDQKFNTKKIKLLENKSLF